MVAPVHLVTQEGCTVVLAAAAGVGLPGPRQAMQLMYAFSWTLPQRDNLEKLQKLLVSKRAFT